MTPLADALTTAQRRALAALEKAYVAGHIEAETLPERLASFGVNDPTDVAFLLAALDVLREWGVAEPTMAERVAAAKVEGASEKQADYIKQLVREKGVKEPPDLLGLTKAQASQLINELQRGEYDPAKWLAVPF